MKDIKNLSSTGVYAYTTLISCLICVPLALFVEGPTLKAGVDAAVAKVGAKAFYGQLLLVGLLYHLYNQVWFLGVCDDGCAQENTMLYTNK